MSNIYQHTPITYFQIPEAVIESGKWAKLKPAAQSLYILLLYRAQRGSSPLVSLTAVGAKMAGVSVNSFTTAKDALRKAKLIIPPSRSNGHLFELLDPATGKSLETLADISQVGPEIVGMYFSDYLGSRTHTEYAGGMNVNCPFHAEKKDRDKHLSISFTDGGMFHCHVCKAKGGIVDFEMLMAKKGGKPINRDKAFANVRSVHLTNMRKQRKQQAQELAVARALL